MNMIYLDGVEIDMNLFPTLKVEELQKFSNLCVSYLCLAERERFFDILAHFNKENQEWIIPPIIDLMCKSRYRFSWMVYEHEPKEYVAMSEEICDLFEGLLWHSEPKPLFKNDAYRVELIAIDDEVGAYTELPF